jgi:D-threo-aldose 1-dehydrogenase
MSAEFTDCQVSLPRPQRGAGDDRGWKRPLGGTGLTVTAVCAGGAPLGSMPENFGYEVGERDAVELVQRILASPIRFLDTANGYSCGRSEERIGEGIRRSGGLPDDFLVATKVDAMNGDFSGNRVLASVRESKARLGLSALPLVYLHDPEFEEFVAMTRPGGALEVLVRLREDGEIGHIGLAGGQVQQMARYLELGMFEVLLVHNRWTVVDHSATELIQQAQDLGVAVVNAAIYGGGILANPNAGTSNYGYRPAKPATLAAIAQMADLCAGWKIELSTAALLASLRDTRIASTVVGFSKASRLKSIMDAAATELPDEFWAELEQLTPPRENWLDFQ